MSTPLICYMTDYPFFFFLQIVIQKNEFRFNGCNGRWFLHNTLVHFLCRVYVRLPLLHRRSSQLDRLPSQAVLGQPQRHQILAKHKYNVNTQVCQQQSLKIIQEFILFFCYIVLGLFFLRPTETLHVESDIQAVIMLHIYLLCENISIPF